MQLLFWKCFLYPFCFVLLGAGMGGHYVLDEYGDRDVNFSIIYTSAVTGKVRRSVQSAV